ncbi:3-oxoacyl-ACP reductase [Cupriavidus sp. TKC]|uniref:SDR family NAD(P)-dependent oxidoreductase n=1 Tax=unclassified Cupriavidus TaxID=2640874 RepID=UPI0002A448F9|nr:MULTISPECIES: SDR family NAD(P)-dependent oxidoreductase [unclassified Cupriavidus]ELA00683.1 3-oxoacyl-ACP reductase [Cupriavidus sp. HMR-1]GMG90985.1 3-oxoacyl-ACP reductase [Cupriavidus sp. TKC]
MLLKDKIALVTGAARGIGYATAELFAHEGAHVVLSGRSVEHLEAAQARLGEAVPGVQTTLLQLDVARPDSVRDAFQALFKQTKRLDVLVSNAGVLDDALISMVTEAQIQRVFEPNTYGVLYCSQYASRLMARNKGGSIINLASIIGTNGNVGQAVYAGSKAAVIGITKSLAKELAPQNIRVNAIAPGFIDTDMARSIGAEKFAERVASVRMGRVGTPEEIAKVALFLASDLSSYVTGQVIGVDGGMLI